MLIIETYLDISPERGVGLFAKHDIPIGTKYWIRNESFDNVFSIEDFVRLEKLAAEYVFKYGFQEITGDWYLCSDNSRFSNHSALPNTSNCFDKNGLLIYSIISKNISKGEEIFIDYTEICATCKNGVIF